MRLEWQYRLLARAFPSRWRQRHGDDLVTTLLDGSAHGQRVVSVSDAADVVGRGLQTRFRDTGPAAQILTVGMAAILVTTAVNGSAASIAPVTELTAAHNIAEAYVGDTQSSKIPVPHIESADAQLASVRSGTGTDQADHGHVDCSRLMFEQNT